MAERRLSEPPYERCVEAIVERLGRRIRLSPRVVEGNGVLAVCWPVAVPEDAEGAVQFLATVDGAGVQGRVGQARIMDVAPGDIRRAAANELWRAVASSLSRRYDPRAHGPEVEAALHRMVASMDVMAVYVTVKTGVRSPEALSLLASDRPHARTLRAFALSHPWLVPTATAFPDAAREAAASGDPDAVAEAVLAPFLPHGHAADAPRIVGLLRGQPHLLTPTPGSLALLATLPQEAFNLYDGRDYAPQALHKACWFADRLAAASGRSPRSVLGRVPATPDYLSRLARRGGHRGDISGASAALSGINDLVRAFHADVVAPARAALDREQPLEGDGETDLDHDPFSAPGTSTATRILLGERTLPALVEVSARWHRRADGIARTMAAATAGHVGEGHRLCPDIPLVEGAYLTCLVSVGELVDEGSPGPDAAGVPGLDHCVGSYAEEVVTGGAYILSLRRRLPGGGYERMSTAEVRLDDDGIEVVQHRARGNADPTVGMEVALQMGLARIDAGQLAAARAFVPAPDAWPSPLATARQPGLWERMRDAWAFALPRPLRTAGPAEILAYGGEHG